MNSTNNKDGIWFVYDGECPLCTAGAQALRIKEEYGTLHLLDARKANDHPLIKSINQRGLDLDEGMVIIANDHFHHGKEALKFMACYGEARNIETALCKSLFWSNTLASLLYPLMRSTRNFILRRKNIGPINNLKLPPC